MPLYKKGEATEKQPIYVGDVVSGIVAAIKDPGSAGRTYQFVGYTFFLNIYFFIIKLEQN